MKRSSFIILFFTIFSIISDGQEYFNNRYNITGQWLWDFSTTILPESDRYILAGEIGSEDYIEKRRISFVKLDLYGNQDWIKIYGDTSAQYVGGYPGFLISTDDSLYIMAGTKSSTYPGWRRDQGLLMRLNYNMDTLWTRLYGDIVEPCDSAFVFRQLISLNEQGYAIIGNFMNSIDNKPQIYFARIDSSGNILWNKWLVDTVGYNYPYCVSATSDNGFVITGTHATSGIQTIDPVIFKLDSLGNTEWYQNIGSPFIDFYPFVDTTNDGNIIVGTIISDSALSTSNYYGRIYYLKLDNLGNVIWDRKYGKSQIGNRLWSIKALDNGNIVTTGSRFRWYPETPFRIGWMLCANSEGDSLWYREYVLLQGADSENYLYDVAQTNDSGFVACGYVYPVSPDTGTQDTWVIKVDSIGCESPEFCWTGIEEPNIKPVEKGKLTAFPNPATNHISFSIEGESFQSGTQISIYNIYGMETTHETLFENTCVWQIKISFWPPGVYIARMVLLNKVVGSVKFVVN